MESLQNMTELHSWASYSVLPVAGLLVYVCICSVFRFRRVNALQAKYGFHDRASLQGMTNEQAHRIVKHAATFEFPTSFDLALRIALFRTYAIEGIAKLLVARSDLNKPQHAPKRYEDTSAVFVSFLKFAPDSDSLFKAVARMNYLHGPLVKAGQITNSDLLYTLWASMADPIHFMARYEWRALTDMEVAAVAMLWKYVGEMMQIDYEAEMGQSQWRDGIEFYEQLTEWAYGYEDVAMKRLPEAQKLGAILIELLLSSYPRAVRSTGYTGILVLLGDRMRHCFRLPNPSIFDVALVHSIMSVRKTFVRFFTLPRLFEVKYLSDPDPATGRIHSLKYLKEPWYARVSLWTRWSPEALLTWATGGQIPGDGGAEMLPEGFLYTDLGPRGKMGRGLEETHRLEEVVKTSVSASACPFAMK